MSCSSSTTMRPSLAKGKNSADRAPTTSDACPEETRRQFSRRFAVVNSECQTVGRTPKRDSKWANHCALRAISGNSTSAWRPTRSVSAMASKYTSVLPEPVTPSSSCTRNRSAFIESQSLAAALRCNSERTGGT